jgi:RNA polymerase sigma-70 factor, ECF subfamily
MAENDRELVQKCLAGDHRQFELLVEKYQKPLYNSALRMTGNPDDAADITQTVFVKAWLSLAKYNPQYEFFSWIYRILVNEAVDCINDRKQTTDLPDEIIDYVDGPIEDLSAKDLEEQVDRALGELNLSNREVIVLRHFAHLSYEEIGYVLDIPEKTVKSRLFTARRILGELLTGQGIGSKDERSHTGINQQGD